MGQFRMFTMSCSVGPHPEIPMSSGFYFPPANVFDSYYRYTRRLVTLESLHATAPHPSCGTGPTPVSMVHLHSFLACHPDRVFAAIILRGLAQGFRIGFNHSVCQLRSRSKNHPSALTNTQVVDDYLAAELSSGRLLGPVSGLGVHVSPIGLVPKAHQSNRWRLIVDLS